MKIEYLSTSSLGVRWFKQYYRRNPQLDRMKAVVALKSAERLLQDNPFAGARFEDFDDIREKEIVGTSFSLLYIVARDTIWIVDLRDQRGNRSIEALRHHNKELRDRFNIQKD